MGEKEEGNTERGGEHFPFLYAVWRPPLSGRLLQAFESSLAGVMAATESSSE